MSGSTARQGLRSRVLRLAAIALVAVLAVACSEYEKDFHVSLEEERGDNNGALQGLVVNGKGFTPNGRVLVTFVLSATGGTTNPYVEETINADGNGEFRLEKKPVPCPQPPDYRSGVYTLVVARDDSAGISGSATLEGGREPDCQGSSS